MTREEAIDVLKANYPDSRFELLRDAVDMAIKALQEPERKRGKWIIEELTYDEKCIFLAAIGRERRICKEMDEEPELKAKPLVPIVDEIKRKVMAVLWGENNG